jgi:hypothetical protein
MDARTSNRIDPATVLGWGVDANPENDPTYPMRDRSHEEKSGSNWLRPPVQNPGVEILQSNEHIRQPAVVGTSTPPSGLSGVIRRAAFKYSESQWMHWLMLIFADRVNVVEGNLSDLGHGRLPNHFREMGLASEWRSNRGRFIRRGVTAVAVVAVAAGVVGWLLSRGD